MNSIVAVRDVSEKSCRFVLKVPYLCTLVLALPTRAVGRGASLTAELRKTKLDGTSQISGIGVNASTSKDLHGLYLEICRYLVVCCEKTKLNARYSCSGTVSSLAIPRRDGRCGLTHICTKQP
eukprot:gene14755-5861_t